VVESGRKKAAAAGKKGRGTKGARDGKKRKQERRRQEAGKKGTRTLLELKQIRFYPLDPRHPRSIPVIEKTRPVK
jgi:hypothetical protein